MTARLDVVEVRNAWETMHPQPGSRCACSLAAAVVPLLLDHIDVLHRAVRRTLADPNAHHPGYLKTICDEIGVTP